MSVRHGWLRTVAPQEALTLKVRGWTDQVNECVSGVLCPSKARVIPPDRVRLTTVRSRDKLIVLPRVDTVMPVM